MYHFQIICDLLQNRVARAHRSTYINSAPRFPFWQPLSTSPLSSVRTPFWVHYPIKSSPFLPLLVASYVSSIIPTLSPLLTITSRINAGRPFPHPIPEGGNEVESSRVGICMTLDWSVYVATTGRAGRHPGYPDETRGRVQ